MLTYYWLKPETPAVSFCLPTFTILQSNSPSREQHLSKEDVSGKKLRRKLRRKLFTV